MRKPKVFLAEGACPTTTVMRSLAIKAGRRFGAKSSIHRTLKAETDAVKSAFQRYPKPVACLRYVSMAVLYAEAALSIKSGWETLQDSLLEIPDDSTTFHPVHQDNARSRGNSS
jgi:hypothetical protein